MFSLLEFCQTCRSDGTAKTYRASLCHFMEFVSRTQAAGRIRTPAEIAKLDQVSIQYISSDNAFFDDLLKYSVFIRHLSPKTQNLNVGVVKIWFEINKRGIARDEWRIIGNKLPRNRAITKDAELSVDTIKTFCAHLGVQARALTLVLMSSGMRIGETLSLTFDDIDFSASPVEIDVKEEYTKTKEQRYTFISSEANASLQEWLKVRGSWLISAQNRSAAFGHSKPVDDDRLFPIGTSTVCRMYSGALKKAGMYLADERTGRGTITPHSFRRFFFSQLKTAMDSEMVEMIGGHRGYLSDAYRRYPKDQVREAYLQGEYAVSLSTPGNLAEMKDAKDKLNAVISDNIRLHAEMDTKIQNAVNTKFEQFAAADKMMDAYFANKKAKKRK